MIDDQDEKDNEKKILAEKLIDRDKPEMITFVSVPEVDDISAMLSVSQDIDFHRDKLGMNKGFLSSFLNNNLIVRTSIKGKRSVQLVDTINAVSREEVFAGNPLQNVVGRS